MITVGKVAALLGVHPDTVRNYERRGIIPPAKRSPINGYRIWDKKEIPQILESIRARNLQEEPDGR